MSLRSLWVNANNNNDATAASDDIVVGAEHDTAGSATDTHPESSTDDHNSATARLVTHTHDTGTKYRTTFDVTIANANCDVATSPSGKHVYLTFDDGPSTYTPEVLAILEQEHVHATFFTIGEQVGWYPSSVRRELADGNHVGDHTWDHQDLTTLSDSQVRSELNRARDALITVTGITPTLWRPPYGSYNATDKAIAASTGMRMELWDVDPQDWSRPGTLAIEHRVLDNVSSGDIVLMHDGGGDRSETVAALRTVIDTLKARGYSFEVL